MPQGTRAVILVELTVICEEGRGKQLASHEAVIPIQLNRLETIEKKVLKRVFTKGRDTEHRESTELKNFIPFWSFRYFYKSK
jgi:hypothetical protein